MAGLGEGEKSTRMCPEFRKSIGKPAVYTGEEDSGVDNFRVRRLWVVPGYRVWAAKVNQSCLSWD